MSCFQAFDHMCSKIVCPHRHSFNEKEIIMRKFKNTPPEHSIQTVLSTSNCNISVIYFPSPRHNQQFFIPTLLYLHGNGGSKLECLQLVAQSEGKLNIVAMDFAGCGKSEGTYLTYGDREVEDIASVVAAIKKKFGIQKVSIWGRSMGASLAIMYASSNPQSVTSLILDTPFKSLKQVVFNIARHNKQSIPAFLINFVLYLAEQKLIQLTGTNPFASDFQMHLNLLNHPALFMESNKDEVVKQQNVEQMFEAYRGKKEIITIQVEHHQDRPRRALRKALDFIRNEEEEAMMNKTSRSFRKGIGLSLRGYNSLQHFPI